MFSAFGSSAPTAVTVYENIQLEVGSSVTTYEPYSNICPITGCTGANVYQAGKNLANLSNVTDGTVSGETVSVSGSGNYMAAHIACFLKGGIKYTFSAKATRVDSIARIAFRDLNSGNTYMSSNTISSPGNLSVSYTPPKDIMLRLAMFSTFGSSAPTAITVYENIQLEVGPSVTAYEPYQGGAYTIPFPTPPGTVYGGELTVGPDGSGTLVVGRGNIASYAGESLPGAWISDRDVYAAGTTPTTGAQVVYALANTVSYALTAEQIMLVRGLNKVWADTGDTTLTYRADIPAYIDQRINATRGMVAGVEAEMKATKAYSAGDLLIVGDTLYKATTSIASGATFTPGTNVTATTVAEQLILLANA
jgi:hypothetical protein